MNKEARRSTCPDCGGSLDPISLVDHGDEGTLSRMLPPVSHSGVTRESRGPANRVKPSALHSSLPTP
jgi:hypothetical protein